jgi:4-amino-4-deoxy-L-arabinose transferase-like glycosyltransferase
MSERALRNIERGALLFATVTALTLAIEVQQSPHGIRPIVDERFYVEWARAIAHGDVMGDGPFWLDPLPAYVLGVVFALTHDSLFAGRLLFALLAVGTVAVTGALARTLWGRREGAIAMWLLALYGPHTFMSGFLLKEALTVHLTAWALLLGVRVQMPSAGKGTWVALGFVAGALGVCRGNYVPLLPLLVAWAAWLAWRAREVLRAGLLTGAAVLPLALASAHNLAKGGGWRPTTPLGGHNFFIGNHEGATGAFDQFDWVKATTKREHTDWLAEAERRAGRALTQQEASDYWFKEGLQFWASHPLEAVSLTVR